MPDYSQFRRCMDFLLQTWTCTCHLEKRVGHVWSGNRHFQSHGRASGMIHSPGWPHEGLTVTYLTQTSGKNLCISTQCPGIPNTHLCVHTYIGAPRTFWVNKRCVRRWEGCRSSGFWGWALTCAWCTWTSWGCLCIVCSRSGQRGERRTPARSRRSWGWTRKEVRGWEKLQFPVAAAHGTPVSNIFTSRILEIWVSAKSRKGLPSARPPPEVWKSLASWYRHRDITVSNKLFSFRKKILLEFMEI